jgi:transposase
MLSLPSIVKIYLHAAPVNLHFAFDRLAAIVREEMGCDPLSGHLFVFRNRRGDRVKLLFWDDDARG